MKGKVANETMEKCIELDNMERLGQSILTMKTVKLCELEFIRK